MVHLTGRETDVIKLLINGKTNFEISKELFISVHTVKSILEKIYEKTDCHNRVQIVIWAIKHGFSY